MSVFELLEPVLRDGIKQLNYHNGQVLSAEQLKEDQQFHRQRDWLLGKSIGDGVLQGLFVEKDPALTRESEKIFVVKVDRGTAINRLGQVLHLEAPVSIHLVKQKEAQSARAGLFAACDKTPAGTILTNQGLYLLTVLPASGFSGRIAHFEETAFGVTQVDCLSKYAVEGVLFRLLRIPAPDNTSKEQLRNLAAHACLGTVPWEEIGKNLIDFATGKNDLPRTSIIQALRSNGTLDDCEVPLALISWEADILHYIDCWAVRRALSFSRSRLGLPLAFSGVKMPCGEAAFLQFQAQMEDIRSALSNAALEALQVDQNFRYLPPAGLVPVNSTAGKGVNLKQFWGSHVRGYPDVLDPQQWRAILNESLDEDPIDLSEPGYIHLYSLKENQDDSGGDLPRFVLFAKDTLMKRFRIPVRARSGSSKIYDSDALKLIASETAKAYRNLLKAYKSLFNSTPRKVVGTKPIFTGDPGGGVIINDPGSGINNPYNSTTRYGVINPLNSYSAYSPARLNYILLPLIFTYDYAGISAIEDVITVALKIDQDARARSLNQAEAVAAFDALAHAQGYFVDTWQEIFSHSELNRYYTYYFEGMIAAIRRLLREEKVGAGLIGLCAGVRGFDLFELDKTQKAINDQLNQQSTQLPKGNLTIRFVDVSKSPFEEGDVVYFLFRIQTDVDIAETYYLDNELIAEKSQLTWKSSVRYLDETLKPIEDNTLKLDGKDEVLVNLQINGVPSGTNGTGVVLKLLASSQKNAARLFGFSTVLDMTVGEEVGIPAEDIGIIFAGVEGNAVVGPDGRVLIPPRSEGGRILFAATFGKPGTYKVLPSLPKDDAGEWEMVLLSPDPKAPKIVIGPDEINQPQTIDIGLLPDNSEVSLTNLALRLEDEEDKTHGTTYFQAIGPG